MATKKAEVRKQVTEAVEACHAKKAEELAVLELDKASGGFTDYFVICTGSNPRQIQAISDEVEQRLGKSGVTPTHVEGYRQAEWVLLDYVDFVVHVFSPKARHFYNLERLWKSAKQLEASDLRAAKKRPRAKSSSRKTPAARTRTRKRQA
jgi:ribosome-associated protein